MADQETTNDTSELQGAETVPKTTDETPQNPLPKPPVQLTQLPVLASKTHNNVNLRNSDPSAHEVSRPRALVVKSDG